MRRSDRSRNIPQKKSLGQVFLQEDWPCRKMVDHLVRLNVQHVIEIGPGLGVLTKGLLEAGINVLAVEKDSRFAERMNELKESHSFKGELNIINKDILKVDLEAWLDSVRGKRAAICGNIPYNISSSILQWFLPFMAQLKAAVLMVQLEFGQRVAANPSTKSYGSLSVFTQLRAQTSLDFKVSRSCFYPIPKVDSAVICLFPLKKVEDQKILNSVEILTRKAFCQRRKMMSNSLSQFLKDKPADEFSFDLTRRCETVSPAEFVSMAKELNLHLDQESSSPEK